MVQWLLCSMKTYTNLMIPAEGDRVSHKYWPLFHCLSALCLVLHRNVIGPSECDVVT